MSEEHSFDPPPGDSPPVTADGDSSPAGQPPGGNPPPGDSPPVTAGGDSPPAGQSPGGSPPPGDSSPGTGAGTGEWWGLDSDGSAASWRPGETPLLDGLMNVPSWHLQPEKSVWRPGYELNIHGFGGLVSRERRRYTLVGHSGSFLNQTGRHRSLAADNHSSRVEKDRLVTIARPKKTYDIDAPWGLDRLAVEGDASYTIGTRTLLMSGIVQRNWNGGVMRLASMEGIVCGGVMTRVIASPSATMSGLMTGDVYGGIARTSAVRTYLAVLQYRSAEKAAWALGVYVRNATFIIEPLVSAPVKEKPSDAAKKMSRLARTASKVSKVAAKTVAAARMICPLVDIMAGVVMLPVAAYGIISAIIAKIAGKPPAPPLPPGPPRVRNRTVACTTDMFAEMMFL